MILVVGATGFLGEKICERLIAKNKKVRAMTRISADRQKTDRLIAMGAEVVSGDLKNPKSLDRACAGVDAVITTATAILSQTEGDSIASVDQNGSLALVDAALANKVDRFVYISFPEISDEFPLQNAKRRVETKLVNSKMGYTILRPTYFMEVWLGPAVGFDPVNGTAVVHGNGDSPVSWISIDDVAEAAALCVDHPEMKNEIVELGGPEAKSQKEVIAAFEAAGVAPVEITALPEALLKEKRAAARQPDSAVDPSEQSIDALMLGVIEGKVIDMKEVQKKMPMQLTTLDDYIRGAMSSKPL